MTNTTGYYLEPVTPPSPDGASEFLINRPGPDPIKGFGLELELRWILLLQNYDTKFLWRTKSQRNSTLKFFTRSGLKYFRLN